MLILLVCGLLLLAGCATIPADDARFLAAWEEAEELGYHPETPAPQKDHAVVWVDWAKRGLIAGLCKNAVLQDQTANGCTIMTGTGPNDVCVNWVIQGDWLRYFHEKNHCIEGQFHRKGENYTLVANKHKD